MSRPPLPRKAATESSRQLRGHRPALPVGRAGHPPRQSLTVTPTLANPWPGRPDPGKAVLAVNGVIAAVGGTYASIHSLTVTVVAGCAGLACAALVTWKS